MALDAPTLARLFPSPTAPPKAKLDALEHVAQRGRAAAAALHGDGWDQMQAAVDALSAVIGALAPECPERSHALERVAGVFRARGGRDAAIDQLREAVMWANVAILIGAG